MPRNLLTYLLALAGLTGGPGAAQGPATDAPAVCGPRCVEFLLHWYDRPADVSDLIDELQQGRPYQAVSLLTMAEALHKRGVHTKAVRLGWGATGTGRPSRRHGRSDRHPGRLAGRGRRAGARLPAGRGGGGRRRSGGSCWRSTG